ncbi:MAG: glycoside hydrolase family 125 protein [Marinifilaceae bacterium]
MVTRRNFLKTTGLITAGLGLNVLPTYAKDSDAVYLSCRPSRKERKFVSKAVEAKIREVKASISNSELAWMFENCLPNTLDTTVEHQIVNGKPDTFVITGDIHAMWLRDSTAQVWPYLPFAKEDKELKLLLEGVVNRQTKCVLIDPYANAFNFGPTGSHWEKDLTDMKPELHERKWEIDSLCYTIRLSYGFWKATGETACFNRNWIRTSELILQTFIEQQRKSDKGPYKFMRVTGWQTDTVAGGGYGNPVKPVGLICSIFRPSDDASIYPFLVPANHFAVVSLRQMAQMHQEIHGRHDFAMKCRRLADEVEEALKEYAVTDHLDYGKIMPYEVDGFGNKLFMDDANIPSLLSMPYLGCMDVDNDVYQNTRRFVLSENNPYFFKGKVAEGIGGPHVGLEMIWPMSLIMQGLTSTDKKEMKWCLDTLVKTHGGTGFMHETFHMDNPKKYTRKWFAWANTLFGEFVLKIHQYHPELLS